MSNDISTMYTKRENKLGSRRGYYAWKYEKITSISPANYGSFVSTRRRKKK